MVLWAGVAPQRAGELRDRRCLAGTRVHFGDCSLDHGDPGCHEALVDRDALGREGDLCGAGVVGGAAALDQLDVLIIINPNNPSGQRFTPEELLAWQQNLSSRGGWLIVDEAFIDPTPEHSLAPHAQRPGLIILRSLGKFFGLAGARVGFVLAETRVLQPLNALLGPWPIATPARRIARLALHDRALQRTTRDRLHCKQARLANLLARHQLIPHGGCALFQWTCTPHAAALHHALAQRGILTRLFDAPHSLRFGLPPDERAWQRLSEGLTACQN